MSATLTPLCLSGECQIYPFQDHYIMMRRLVWIFLKERQSRVHRFFVYAYGVINSANESRIICSVLACDEKTARPLIFEVGD